jgi:hypothetical protein
MLIALSMNGSTTAWLINPRTMPAINPEKRVMIIKGSVFNFFTTKLLIKKRNTWLGL